MNTTAKMTDDLRERIITRPDVILEDKDLMKALIEANERAMGGNIVDLRGIAMERLEARLDRRGHASLGHRRCLREPRRHQSSAPRDPAHA